MKRFHHLLILAIILAVIGLSLHEASSVTHTTPVVSDSNTADDTSNVDPNAPSSPGQVHRHVSSTTPAPVTASPPNVSNTGFQIIEFLKKIFPGLPDL